MPDGVNGALVPDIRVPGTANLPVAAPLNSTSLAYEASRLVKEGAGVCYGAAGYSSKTAAQFVLIFDSRGVPTAQASPVEIIAVPATGNWSYNPGIYGRAFSAGIYFANSSTAPALLAGSADTWFDVQYR